MEKAEIMYQVRPRSEIYLVNSSMFGGPLTNVGGLKERKMILFVNQLDSLVLYHKQTMYTNKF